MGAVDWRDKSDAKLQASLEGVKRFKQDRFGMSIHWGLYNLDAQKEWMQALQKVTYTREKPV